MSNNEIAKQVQALTKAHLKARHEIGRVYRDQHKAMMAERAAKFAENDANFAAELAKLTAPPVTEVTEDADAKPAKKAA